jgi:Protein of unknown function (DUF1549)/Protein of unknown function (DUF1553)
MHLLVKLSVPLALMSGLISWQVMPVASNAAAHVSSHDALSRNNGDHVPAAGPSVSAIKPLDAKAIADASKTIDRLIDAALTQRDIKSQPRAVDEVFLRRVYLDIVGRIPTAQEANDFLTNLKSDKREALIKQLIGSEGYLSHQYNYWADLLRATSRLQNRYPGQSYIDYLKQSLRDNKPYDKWVSEMIQAEGHALAPGNGATGYYIRDAGMPLDNMSNTIQIFLGTQLACAQCHNHPTDKWTRMDYFQMAAFTTGTSVDKNYNGDKEKVKFTEMLALKKQIKEAPLEVRNAMKRFGETVGLVVKDTDSASIKLPADYQYADAKGGSKVEAEVMMGTAEISKNTTPRSVYASWMISQERFAQVIANRMWKKVMGMGLVEPVDNYKDDTVASHPEVMEFITRLMVAVKFDLRKFQEILYATETYQRATLRTDVEQADYAFQGRLLHRLTAEQAWDSLMTLAVSDIDTHKGADATDLYAMYEKEKDFTPMQVFEQANSQVQNREKAVTLKKEFEVLKAKMASAKEGAEKIAVLAELKALGERRDEIMQTVDPLVMKKKFGEGKGSGARDSKMGQGNLLRASELPSPAPSSHFLRTFGQSDRELIDNSTTDAAVTQALALMNGMVEVDILTNRSVLYGNVMKVSGAEDKAKALWMTILSRQPTMQEMTMASRLLAIDKNAANDLAWALINSREFLFVQ